MKMSTDFTDSFDHLAVADILQKWTSHPTTSATLSITSAAGRNGTNGLRFSTSIQSGRMLLKTLSSEATRGLAFAFKCSGLPGNITVISEFADAGTVQCDLRLLTDGTLRITRAGTTLGTTTFAISAGGSYHIEWKVLFNDSTGTAEIRVNDDTKLSLTGQDTKNTSNASANQFTIGQRTASGNNSVSFDFDDVVSWNGSGSVNNDFHGDCRVEALFASGAGNSAQFTPSAGSNYQNVDEAAADGDTTYNSDTVAGNKDTFTFTNPTPAAGTVKAVQVNLIARKDDAGTRTICPVIRHSSTDYDGSNQNLSTSYADYLQVYENNPGTGSPFTLTEVANAEFGYKLIA
jgi:hypothetical protein